MKKLTLIDAPREGQKRIIRIFLADLDFTVVNILRIPRQPADRLIEIHGNLAMLSERAWIVSYADELRAEEQQYISQQVNTTRINLKPGSSADQIKFAHMHIVDGPLEPPWGKGIPRIVDVQLGRGNVFVEQIDNAIPKLRTP